MTRQSSAETQKALEEPKRCGNCGMRVGDDIRVIQED